MGYDWQLPEQELITHQSLKTGAGKRKKKHTKNQAAVPVYQGNYIVIQFSFIK